MPRGRRRSGGRMATSHLTARELSRVLRQERMDRGEIPLLFPNMQSTVWLKNPGRGKRRVVSMGDYRITVYGGKRIARVVEKKGRKIVKKWKLANGRIIRGN